MRVGGAVSTAKALIESTGKYVLTARGQAYSPTARVSALVNALKSRSVSHPSRSATRTALRQALQSLVTLTQSVTELGNSVGIDHGAEPAHARDSRRP